MNFVNDCYTSVEKAITIIILLIFVVPLILSLKFPQRKVLMYEATVTILILVVLLLIPIDKEVSNVYPHKLADGSWIRVYKINDPRYYKKVWKTASEYISVSSKLGLNFIGDGRCIFDLIAWKFCMAAQWQSIQNAISYRGLIDSIVSIKNVDEINLSYEQEICRNPTREDVPTMTMQFKTINEQLRKYNLYYIDIHSKNVMIDSKGNVKFIDGELLSESNFKIACFIYEYIVTPPLVNVHGFDRIYWSHENENTYPPLDSLNHMGKLIKHPYI
jgi:hypothetical protein